MRMSVTFWMKQSDRCDCRRQTPWANLLRSPGGATWSVLGVGGAPSGFFFFGGALAWSGLYSCRLERKDTTLKDTVIKAFSEDERFDAVPQRQASSYASRGRGCCWTTSGPLVCLRPGSCVPVLCISWHSWGGGGGKKKTKNGTNSDNERARRDLGVLPTWRQDPQCSSKSGLREIQHRVMARLEHLPEFLCWCRSPRQLTYSAQIILIILQRDIIVYVAKVSPNLCNVS